MAVVLLVLFAAVGPLRGVRRRNRRPRARNPRKPRSTAMSRRQTRTSRGRSCASFPRRGVTATLIEMTSQQWLTDKEVERPLWTHWITVVRPDDRSTSDIGLLFISGGSNDRPPPARPAAWLVDAARDTGTVTAELRLVPNQPVDLQGRSVTEAAHGRRLHRLHVGQVPAHRRREVARPSADDQERRPRHGRDHGVYRDSRGRRAKPSTRSSSPAGRSAAGRRGPRRRSTAASSRSLPR